MILSRMLHYAARFLILYGFAWFILTASRSGLLLLYIEPSIQRYVVWSAFFLYAMAVYQIYLAVVNLWTRRQAACECEDLPSFRLKQLAIYAGFALPVILGLAVRSS
ncbi:MAG: hypothetical protein K0R57_2959 [Paenibacillaceae bacterium]|nr:hypothetical protein [Paenibacillaceae bacterium]